MTQCTVAVAVALALAGCVGRPRSGASVPDARVEPAAAVDYADEAALVEIRPTLASLAATRTVLAALPEGRDEERIRQILDWVSDNLRYDESVPWDRWRTFDEILRDGRYGGCAEHSLLVGALTRASGIPTVWVKSLDSDWIWDVRRGREIRDWRGHVFLEVKLRGSWQLLDASEGSIYEDYDVTSTVLPGGRVAYGRGADPYELVLSPRAAEWRRDADRVARRLDPSRIAVGRARAVSGRRVA